jgi:hypothetical protein
MRSLYLNIGINDTRVAIKRKREDKGINFSKYLKNLTMVIYYAIFLPNQQIKSE